MKLIVNKRDGYCESINIEYTPTEALIINHAMRRYACDDEDKGENTKWELKKNPIVIERVVLDKIRAEIMKLQTYKMFGGEDTVYVEHEDVLAIIDKYKAERTDI